MDQSFPRLIPPRITPPARSPQGLAFLATFVRNPLQVVPQAAYEEGFVPASNGRVPRTWVTEPSIIKAVLLDEREKFRKSVQIRMLSPVLGRGILTTEGAEWKWQRQAAAPMFRPKELEGYVPAFVAATEEQVRKWRETPRGLVAPIDACMTRTTFDVVCATLLPSSDKALAPVIHDALRTLQKTTGWEILVAATGLPKWLPRPGMIGGRSAVVALRSAVAALVRERRAAGDVASDNLMSRLIAARDPETGQAMSDEQLVDNVLTFYLAGHETTARALTWTLYLLSRSPGWTAALEAEIARVTGGSPVTSEHIEQLVLVQQVLKESMRLYPPVPIMSRQCVTDVQIDGHAIKAGTSIMMPIYAIHRHTKRWEDPDAFDPSRFAPEKDSAIPRYQYMPFGAGPRICIGMAFAMIEATAVLATLLQRVRFERAGSEEPFPVARVTLVPKGGVPLKVWVRE